MNARFRKTSALLATAALVTGGLITLAAPTSASVPTGCEAGCSSFFTPAPLTSSGGYELGTKFSVSDPGVISGACYRITGADLGNDPMSLWDSGGTRIAGPLAANGTGCAYWYKAVPAGTYTASYTPLPAAWLYEAPGAVAGSTNGDMTGITAAYGAPGAFPSTTTLAYDYSVGVGFYSSPNAPTVTVTAVSPTSANGTYVGDGAGGAATMWARCTQSPSYDTGQNAVTTGANGPYLQTPLATNGQPVICTSQETGPNLGLLSPVGTAQAYLPPPAPIGVAVTQKNLTSVTVTFTGQGTNIDHYTATCTSSAGGSHSATGSASPIVVTGFTNLTSQVVTCSVTATFLAPNSLTSAPSANGGGVLIGASGPGCAGTVTAAPGQITAAAEAFPGAQVSWAPVTADPASCLVGYLVTPSTGSAVLVLGKTTTLVKGPFAFGSTVTFTVAAVTGSMTGPASAGVTVTIGTPAAVASVHVAHVGKGAVKVAFKASASNGAAITGFTATCGGKSTSGKSSPLIVKGLKAGRTYTCTVRATNSRGTGAAARSAAVKA